VGVTGSAEQVTDCFTDAEAAPVWRAPRRK
jgi:hypothetical protein